MLSSFFKNSIMLFSNSFKRRCVYRHKEQTCPHHRWSVCPASAAAAWPPPSPHPPRLQPPPPSSSPSSGDIIYHMQIIGSCEARPLVLALARDPLSWRISQHANSPEFILSSLTRIVGSLTLSQILSCLWLRTKMGVASALRDD